MKSAFLIKIMYIIIFATSLRKKEKQQVKLIDKLLRLFRLCKLLIACTILHIQQIFASATGRRRDTKILLCLSAPWWKSLIQQVFYLFIYSFIYLSFQLSGVHVLISFLKCSRLSMFFSFSGSISHIFGPKYEIVSVP